MTGYLLLGYLNGPGDLNLLELDASTPRVPYVRPGQEDPPQPPVPPVVTLPPVVLPPAAPDCAAAEKRAKEAEEALSVALKTSHEWERAHADIASENAVRAVEHARYVKQAEATVAQQAAELSRLTAVEAKYTKLPAWVRRYL